MRRWCAAFLAGVFLAILPREPAGAQTSLEYAVKAAYLVKFAPFITWPQSVFASSTAPLTICVEGADPFGADLDRAAQGQRDGDHPLVIRRIGASDPPAPCQILFAGGAPDMVTSEIERRRTRPVLTVTDSGAAPGGIVSFVVIGDHVRFDIDEARANAVGIQISSKLLGLAHAVKRSGRP
jgi:hypothetical protein